MTNAGTVTMEVDVPAAAVDEVIAELVWDVVVWDVVVWDVVVWDVVVWVVAGATLEDTAKNARKHQKKQKKK